MSRVDEVVATARAFQCDELRSLARAGNRALGLLGTKQGPRDARAVAHSAGIAAGLANQLAERSNDSLLAVFDAATEVARQRGRKVAALRVELDQIRGANPIEGAVAVRALRKTARKALGWRLEAWIAPANVVTEMATLAVLTWDLATPDGAYTPTERSTLVQPWLEVASLPDGLS